MTDEPQRPPVRVRFHYNLENGDMEFIVDDVSPDRSEDYHNRVATAIGTFLSRHPEISDAGGQIRYQMGDEWHALTQAYEQKQKTADKRTQTD